MKLYDAIGYIFEGDVHCEDCTSKRFPKLKGTDREGNSVGIYSVNDAENSDSDTSCGDCHESLYEIETA